tara:strand:+ start:314 stop:706 length:393 start_codon:yes stop_codon:yes gene_type:complete
MTISKEITIRSIKMVDISLLGVYYLFGGIILSLIIDKLFPVYDEEVYRNKPLLEIFLEICLNISLIMIIVYILRNIVGKIPFPFDGVAGYDHKRVSEIKGGILIAFAIITFQPKFKNKITLLINRLNNFI